MDDFPDTPATEASQVPNEKVLIGTIKIGKNLHQIFTGTTTIGRHPGCNIAIDHETVSKIHAEIKEQPSIGTSCIKDLHSSNKTRINNIKLDPNFTYKLKDGDEIRFGTVLAKFNTVGL